ncbi:progesterone receptor-like [Megalops cyprinoides]|uniref:progesterone receptor-like n=1 Tax=Megalops cyprinoides TaxID=118141 RepID=UPI0018646E37|nr:progesterone receptor-like [Megalops cyprinoides]
MAHSQNCSLRSVDSNGLNMDIERKDTAVTSMAEPTTSNANSKKRTSDLTEVCNDYSYSYMEGFCQGADSNNTHSLYTDSCVSSTLRNFGNVDTLCSAPGSASYSADWKDLSIFENAVTTHNSCEKEPKLDSLMWTAPVKHNAEHEQSLAAASKESLRSSSGTPIAAIGISKLIKDEQEPKDIMEIQSSDIDLAVNTLPLNPSYETGRIQALGLEDSVTFLHNSVDRRLLLYNKSNFTDWTSINPLGPIPQIRSDQPCSLPCLASEGIPNTDLMGCGQQSPQNVLMCKNDLSVPTSFSDCHIWCQSTGLPENQHLQAGYLSPVGIHNTYTMQRANIGVFSQKVCTICGDEASGCHYGVLTCGSCKVFFKRAIEGHPNYLCAGRNDCIVDKIRRKNCPSCRLRKCYQAGMILGGRKLKKSRAWKSMGLTQSLTVQSLLGQSCDSQALPSFPSMLGVRELQFSPQIITILENIEPEVVYSGYDSSQSEKPHVLLNSLNRLCERQLLWIIRWSKSLPGFHSLHINDQMTLIQHSMMSLMVFSLGWRSFQNVTREYLYFAPDLILSEECMRRSPIYDLCLAMQVIPQEFANLQVTREEFLCMKALMLLSTVPLEGLKGQAQFDEMRQSYIYELTKAIHLREKGVVASSQRFYHLTTLMDAMHEIVKKVNLYCLSTFIQAEALQVEFPEMMSEVITSQLPKVLAGMVKPLLFHRK